MMTNNKCAWYYQAVQEYQSQIASVAAQVLDQYQQLFGAAFLPGGKPLDPVLQEQRTNQLLGELNYSGKYFAFKEQMKVHFNQAKCVFEVHSQGHSRLLATKQS